VGSYKAPHLVSAGPLSKLDSGSLWETLIENHAIPPQLIEHPELRELNEPVIRSDLALAGLAIVTRTDLLLLIPCGLFVIVTMSVVIQVASYKTRRKRVFKMAPLHHHFEMVGWAESTIVVRFWLIAAMFVALGLGIFYIGWFPS
jgi:hypothetical protein